MGDSPAGASPRRRYPSRSFAPRAVRLLLPALLAGVLGVAVVAAAGVAWTRVAARGHVYDERSVPATAVALVLGAQVDRDGRPSLFLAARLELARRLFAAGKVRAILVSGDHSRWEYDEPDVMKAWLVAHGVPTGKVVVDYAGFDTYDSCARARRVFGVRRAIVVTQSFHVPRAVALCRWLGVDAVGVGDDSVRHLRYFWTKAVVREQLACVKAVWDALSGRDPVFLGRHETGVEDALRG